MIHLVTVIMGSDICWKPTNQDSVEITSVDDF